ncbi:hypothetical protein UA08_06852 [Talaromyces atroroseus]|uniref:AB hydrolase-1 domain-containing protein n=1 Tax=Talaromyces atroroseus TaxID=1441469 RepID=A0A225ACZ5_TALAT|nr:hypothetical protein UA08_06852 [Talaromyces atroroseus]OKL58270.1 hypothetical protein UA08_06852 [Talaromyces atroroseus]
MADDSTAAISKVQMDDGVQLNVKILGEDSMHTKPLLIALHGAPGLSTLAEPVESFGFLSDRFRVLVYDARGSGDSDSIGPFDPDRWTKDIENLRMWASADKFVLAGGSYGAFVALDYAVRHGDRLCGLILRAGWTVGKVGSMTAVANILKSKRVKPDAARQVRLWSGTLHSDKDFEDAIMEILPIYSPPRVSSSDDQSESADFKGTLIFHSKIQNTAFGENMPRFDVRNQLQDIKAPTLVLVGRHDYATPVSGSKEIADGIPNSRLEIFENSGHSPSSDVPERSREVVSYFVKVRGLSKRSPKANGDAT